MRGDFVRGNKGLKELLSIGDDRTLKRLFTERDDGLSLKPEVDFGGDNVWYSERSVHAWMIKMQKLINKGEVKPIRNVRKSRVLVSAIEIHAEPSDIG